MFSAVLCRAADACTYCHDIAYGFELWTNKEIKKLTAPQVRRHRLSMAKSARREVLTEEQIAELLTHLKSLPRDEQQFDHEVRHNSILADSEELPKWRARFAELSPEDRERIERVEQVHAQETALHQRNGRELGLTDPPAGPIRLARECER
jgi:hypothetical protein